VATTGSLDTSTVPTHRGLPVLGSLVDVVRDQLSTYEEAFAEHGDVVRVRVGPEWAGRDWYLVMHPEGVQRVLASDSAAHTKDGMLYRQVTHAIGRGLLTSQGEAWKHQRATLQPLFTRKRVDELAELMAREAAELVERWRPSVRDRTRIDLGREMNRYTLRVVGSALFGADVERMIDVVAATFPVLSHAVRQRIVNPVEVPLSWPTPTNRALRRARRVLFDVCDELIAQRRREPADARDDLLARLMQATDPDSGAPLTDEEVRDQTLVFLLAGHETTAGALTFGLHLAARHLDVQERMAEEAAEVLGDGLPGADAETALPYTTMVLKEGMRLYPPAWSVPRYTATGDDMAGRHIPAGSDVIVLPWVTHRHPEHWEDPGRFDPERFTPDRERERHRYAYLPFGGGPRACIGRHFAMLEAVIAAGVLVRHYRFATEQERLRLDPFITVRPAEPVWVRLAAR
jgi:cytochrome P450